ncbi:MAG: DNA-processing protein DprA [bacterium]|nr:DNA-processing protein DprA [bacterium]
MDPLSYLQIAIAEGFGEGPISAVLAPDVDLEGWLRDPPSPRTVPPRVAARLRDPGLRAAATAMREAAAGHGLTVLTPADPRYPDRLHDSPLRPLVLFCRGDPDALAATPAVSVVGSRTPSAYGQEAGDQLARALARSGLVLWSGLARGVDAIAHRAALAARTPTVAVLAGGIDRLYPPEHLELAGNIVAAGGCVVSELPPGRRARRGHFVRRNRILASGASATLVVEASSTSGALHTARFAAECGRDVFAVPGTIFSDLSQGCHRLVTEGAVLVENAENLLRDLGVTGQGQARQLAESADEQAIVDGLTGGARPSDLLQRESGLERPAFLRALLALAERGAIRRLPGDLWAAVR